MTQPTRRRFRRQAALLGSTLAVSPAVLTCCQPQSPAAPAGADVHHTLALLGHLRDTLVPIFLTVILAGYYLSCLWPHQTPPRFIPVDTMPPEVA